MFAVLDQRDQSRQQLLVQILYKRPEIPANCALPAFAVSATYRKQEKAENTGSIPVSATNSFQIKRLYANNGLYANTGDPPTAIPATNTVSTKKFRKVRIRFLLHKA